jgi:uncharacterized protein YlxW (UPF0749 family)
VAGQPGAPPGVPPRTQRSTGAAPRQDPGPAARDRLNLIEQITADAVASDYADSVGQSAPSTRRQRVLIAALALGLAGFVLALGVSARILNAPVVAEQRIALTERVTAADARQDELLSSTAQLRAEVEAARAAELEQILGGAVLAESIAAHELATGYVAVTGPGVVVTLDDAPVAEGEERADLEQVLDSDVQRTVNGLWWAGAEAIAVNGSRLTARTAIRSAADAILVNYRPLRPPYRVEAIGPDTLLDQFLASQDAAELRGVSEQFGIGFSTEPARDLLLPAATSALPENAENIDPEEGEGP